LEKGHVRAAVGKWRLYFETGPRRAVFLADRMTESGRLPTQGATGSKPVEHQIADTGVERH
jgi:hypothetical protein